MKYFFGLLLAIGLIVGVFILVLHGFRGNSQPKSTKPPLVSYADTNRVVSEKIVGPLSTDATHYALELTVSASQNTLQVLHGYNETVTQTFSYNNTEPAFAEFLRALDLAGFTKGNSKVDSDIRGICTAGRRYIFEIRDGANIEQSFWTSSCGGGSFLGSLGVIKDLFTSQIPDFHKVSGLVSL